MSVLLGQSDYGIFVDGAQEAEYVAKVLATSPIAYWILGEHAPETTAYCQIDPNQNGTHSDVTLGNVGIGDGQVCPSYDGVASYTNVYTPAFASAFSGSAGTILAWGKMSGAGAWTDGSDRALVRIQADAQNIVYIRKTSNNDEVRFFYRANNVTEIVDVGSFSETGWVTFALTWDEPADEMKAYLLWDNGASGGQQGATQAGLGVWAGNPAISVIGAASIPLSEGWSGFGQGVAVWDSALALGTIAALATV